MHYFSINITNKLNRQQRRAVDGGFTLIEILFCTMLLAVGSIVVGGICRRCMQDHVIGNEYELAWQLMDERLDVLSARDMGLLVREGHLEGDFGPRYPAYRYIVDVGPAQGLNLYPVRARIDWQARDTSRQITAEAWIYLFDSAALGGSTPPGETTSPGEVSPAAGSVKNAPRETTVEPREASP